MNATILPKKKKHFPVLLNEIISIVTPQYGGTFIDCTFGQGEYSKRILEYPKTKVISLDRDKETIKISQDFKKKFKDRFLFENKKFSQINELNLNNQNVKGIIFDLGYSYIQIKDLTKGLSFDSKGPLNMKMGLNDFSAKDAIKKLDLKDLEAIFKFFGEEKDFKKIAKKIIKTRQIKEIDTQDLVKIIQKSKKKKIIKYILLPKFFKL